MSTSSPHLERLQATRRAATILRASQSSLKDQALRELQRLVDAHKAELLAANELDLQALPTSASPAFQDRLKLTPARIQAMGESLGQVAALPDPVGEIVEERTLENGLKTRKVRAPLGVIFMIFESRPNVALEAFSLAFKSGNALILRGGKESQRTVAVLYRLIQEALKSQGFPKDVLWGITDPDRTIVQDLLQQKRWIDVVVPRGGDSLIEHVTEHSKIPVIKNDRGMCHVYVHEDADLEMALEIIVNAKTQRPGVCNAMETLLLHSKIAPRLVPALYERLHSLHVRWRASPEVASLFSGGLPSDVRFAEPVDWDTEHLDLILNCRTVGSLHEAISHIESHGSRHSEAIVTSSELVAREFQESVDAAAVYWNASTRFTDGFALGLGGELGISTQKLHVRGPVGLRELTSVRWVMDGSGQIRE